MKVRNCCNKVWLETCENEDLLQDWIKGSNSQAGICSKDDCSKPAEYGGCVELTFIEDNEWLNLQSSKKGTVYIIPLCKDHLELFGEEYETKSGTCPVITDRIYCEPLREPRAKYD